MVPKVGSVCDLCALGAHYALACRDCGHAWEEPSFPCELICPHCGSTLEVTPAEHEAFAKLVQSSARPLAAARRPSGIWGWAEQVQASRSRAG